MIIPVNILCKHSRVNNPWRTILPTKTHMDARHPRTELKTMSSLGILHLHWHFAFAVYISCQKFRISKKK